MESLKRSKGYDNENKNHLLSSYFQIGRIHGIKYLSSQRNCDRIFWGSVLLISITLMTYFLLTNQHRQSSIIEISDKSPLHNIPFPAVTICPETKAKKSIVNVTDAYHNLIYNLTEYQYDDESLSYIEALTQVCDPHLFSSVNIRNGTPTSGEEFVEILRKVGVQKSEMILFCKFRNEIISCSELFDEVVTDDGVCYTFNMLDSGSLYRIDSIDESSPEWNPEKGYCTNDIDACPKRAMQGTAYGFNVVLDIKMSDLDFICKGPTQGFKVLIHSPDEHPQFMNGFFRIPLNGDVVVAVEPELSINHVNQGDKCHSSETKKLKLFHKYSQRNCLAECLSDFVLKKCSCVSFWMVHKNGTKICNQHDTNCVVQAENDFFITEKFNSEHLCDCKPACTNLKYNIRTSNAEFDYKRVFKAYNQPLEDEFPKSVMSRLTIFFTEDYFNNKTIKHGNTHELDLSWTISKIGGLLAFFLGASVLSVIEIVYFVFKKIINC